MGSSEAVENKLFSAVVVLSCGRYQYRVNMDSLTSRTIRVLRMLAIDGAS